VFVNPAIDALDANLTHAVADMWVRSLCVGSEPVCVCVCQ